MVAVLGIGLGITLNETDHKLRAAAPQSPPPPPAETIWLPSAPPALHFTEPEVCEALMEFYAVRHRVIVPTRQQVLRWDNNCWDSTWHGGVLGNGVTLELKP